jgi:Tfp pilus assembly protein PilF
MSLIADLLSKIKHRKQEGGIPPTLERVILDAKKEKNVKKQIIILGGSALFMVFVGLGIVYYTNVVVEPSLMSGKVKANIQPALQPQIIEPKQSEASPVSVDKVVENKAGNSVENPTGKTEEKTYQKTAKADPSRPIQREGGSDLIGKKAYLNSQNMTKKDEETAKKPRDSAVSQKTEKDGFLYTAKNYEADKNYQQALNYYKKALEIDKRNYVIINNIAGLLINMGLYEEAIKYSHDVLNINKNYVPSIVNIGISYVQSGSHDKGKAYLLKALSLEPSNKNVLLNLALLYEKDKDYDEANKLYSSLYKMEDLRGYLGIARIAEGTNRPDDAKKVYREILALNNVDAKTKKNISERLSSLGNK